MSSATIAKTDLDGILPLIARGKVRDIYEVDDKTLLFIASDRISAYDVIMNNTIPQKGALLTKLSEFWFSFLSSTIRNHLVSIPHNKTIFDFLPEELKQEKYRLQIEGRSLLVQRFKTIPLEVIVRGYITGSAWKEYCKSGTVNGLKQLANLRESEKLPEAIFTPSTKAEQGEHDENISIQQASELVGNELCSRIEEVALELYIKCAKYAESKGIIIADTKFEFGLDEQTNELVLIDEVLTPDSSRFWNLASYKIGESQHSYDKQFLRDWLTVNNLNGVGNVSMPDDIVEKTRLKYIEAFESLTGQKWN
ncbi:hypothetical protein KAFR_0F02290 [Kazachstania africana CBS 2517]|uniref:Phosphoribosylaminoimidazole-succinocarboxamide synthase n=1 Tax=Kazachstania africana (strain ATCC 22294 / BCRC 22015 / CBS 2517 / CECT 1963 / NBRC 1671 / NRRL Y-8276) TaxID=1071382 RepID=H2AWS6_KAZAF|nr:hypothetical protein KAFR_0F02290 [Kazachstania africana CBS 2517]CCF58826.1 hypothetical protein KAFR_0F02290 [Kazachstania africana CBS 2517]